MKRLSSMVVFSLSIFGYLFFGGTISAVELNAGNIGQAPFSCVTTETLCNLNDKNISSIAPGTFAAYSNMQILGLSNNPLTTINTDTFTSLNNLTALYISDSSLKTIEAGAFNGLDSLEDLYLYNNKLTHLVSGTFLGLPLTDNLDLMNNTITSIDAGTFHGMTSLQELELQNNQLLDLEPFTFSGLSSLNDVVLEYNNLSNIQSGVWYGASVLQNINLEHNNLINLSVGSFDNMISLYSLSFAVNYITHINEGVFRDNVAVFFNLGRNGFYPSYSTGDGTHQNVVMILDNDESTFDTELYNLMYRTGNPSLITVPADTHIGPYPISLNFYTGTSNSKIVHPILMNRYNGNNYTDAYYQAHSEIYLPDNTIFKNGANNFTGIFNGPTLFHTGMFSDEFTGVLAVMRAGSLNGSVQLENTKATVLVPAIGKTAGDAVDVYSSSDDGETRELLSFETVVDRGGAPYVEFQTDHFSWFVIVEDLVKIEGYFEGYKGTGRADINTSVGDTLIYHLDYDNGSSEDINVLDYLDEHSISLCPSVKQMVNMQLKTKTIPAGGTGSIIPFNVKTYKTKKNCFVVE